MNKNFYKKLKINLAVSLIITVLLIIGIPLIPVGASKGITILWIIGIVFTAVGFYGTPLMWVSYGNLRSLLPVYESITQGGIRDIQTLSQTLAITEKQALEKVETLKKGMYLFGYTVTLYPTQTKVEKTENSVQCKNCGATFKIKGDVGECPYCGTPANNIR